MELRFDSITKCYGDKMALHDFTYSMNEGIYALLGPNGSGKSTLMNVLSGVLRQTSGDIYLDGEEIQGMKERYRSILGYMPQSLGLYEDFSGLDNLRYFAQLKEVKKTKQELLEELLKVNLSEVATKKFRTYSGGMKRRLGVAVTLLNDPKIIIFDEPTAGLDPKERVRFREIVSELAKEKIVIIATHIVGDVESIAKEALFLKEGELIHVAKEEELTGGSLEAMYMELFGREDEGK